MPGSSQLTTERYRDIQRTVALAHRKFLRLFALRLALKLRSAGDALPRKKFARIACQIGFHDFRTTTSRNFIIIFSLTSFFINSIHQLVAVEDRCKFSMNNGRENRNMATKKKAKKKKKH
jgi:hypothetical protein